MDAVTRVRVARALGAPVVGARAVRGGYTPAERWAVTLADGRTAFAKVGTAGHHVGLDAVPPAERRALVDHIARHFVAPGGRIVLSDGALRRTAWWAV